MTFTIIKIFSKNFTFLAELITKKIATIILQIMKVVLSIFYTLTLIDCIVKPSFFAKVEYIILTSLFKLNKASTRANINSD